MYLLLIFFLRSHASIQFSKDAYKIERLNRCVLVVSVNGWVAINKEGTDEMSVLFYYVNLHMLIRTYVISESLRLLSICIIF